MVVDVAKGTLSRSSADCSLDLQIYLMRTCLLADEKINETHATMTHTDTRRSLKQDDDAISHTTTCTER